MSAGDAGAGRPPVVRRERVDVVTATRYRDTFAAHLPAPQEGDPLPPGWEALCFPFATPLAGLRPDGSPQDDGVLDAVDLPRRLYAGEDTVWHAPLPVGALVTQTARAGQVRETTGRSGRLVFADVVREHRVPERGDDVAVRSTWHDVFLGPPPEASSTASPGRSEPPPALVPPGAARTTVLLDERALFQFSALTFNTHRVHYDLGWARDVEHLPGLLVHGPLLRLLLLDALRASFPGRVVRSASFRSLGPAYAGRPLTLAVLPAADRGREGAGGPGEDDEAVALDDAGALVARVTAIWAPSVVV